MDHFNHNPLIDASQAKSLAESFGTPVYLYDENRLRASADAVLNFPNAFGLTARFAMKACPNKRILALFDSLGLHIDASSGHEVKRAIHAGIDPKKISLSAQEIPEDLNELLDLGIEFNACSLRQIERFGQIRPSGALGIRFNPGSGSGGNNRTNVGGVSSSFGIWHESVPEVKALCEDYDLVVKRIHTHIGSGSDPEVWLKVALMNFQLVEQFASVHTLNLGGGYKVGRMPNEVSTDLQVIGKPVREAFEAFAEKTGREIHCEIEPGTFLTANAGGILAEVHDLVHTGSEGYQFIKLNTGMTELLRPSIYGAQHPITIFSSETARAEAANSNSEEQAYVVVGHCCESGDILTPAPGDPELLAPRNFSSVALGDLVLIGGTGAYASAMTPKHYNSYPEAAEVLLGSDGEARLIRQRQALESLWENEL
ncbi:MAG: diaminopimelate decarboxylase [Puniceicoccaceae bacterium]|nr:diaminopimelate decarboxylase [Puniceicoccaceae bacterium]